MGMPLTRYSILHSLGYGGEEYVTNRVRSILVRIIAATNNDLIKKCRDGKFRWDLYYRICNPEIVLRPYRARTAEGRRRIIDFFLTELGKKWGRKMVFSREARQIIEQ